MRHLLAALTFTMVVGACTSPNASVSGPPTATPARSGLTPFGTAEVEPAFLADGPGVNVDSLAFYEADVPEETLLFVTAKDNQLVEVWQYPFTASELPPIRHPTFEAGSEVNGVAVDQQAARLYVSVSRPRSTVAVFDLPSLSHARDFVDGTYSLGSESNLTLLHHPDGMRLYVTADDFIYILEAQDGAQIGRFEPDTSVETIAGDDHAQILYVPDENTRTGVYAYAPDGSPIVRGDDNTFGASHFDSDAEGVAIYRCLGVGSADTGQGLIVVADQRDEQTDFEIFDRVTWDHLGSLRMEGVSNTDGIASTQRPLPDYPLGLFAAIDDDRRVAAVGWDVILSVTGLACP
ncbi:MAG: phytase [Chloroflexota bacterium]|nr:phytase [Chloroflexota bacterium]